MNAAFRIQVGRSDHFSAMNKILNFFNFMTLFHAFWLATLSHDFWEEYCRRTSSKA